MSLPHAILGVLEARAMTGYELTRFFESTARWVWSAPQSQIYPLLRKLEADGLIAGADSTHGRRRRTTYQLTDSGLRELRDWLGEPHADPGPRDALLLQALFFDLAEPADARRVLGAHIAELEEAIARWSVHRANLLAKDTPLLRERLAHRDPAEHDRIAALKAHVFDYLIRQAALRAEWCRQTMDLVSWDSAADQVPVTAEPASGDTVVGVG